jgi:anti-anti-sigma factor
LKRIESEPNSYILKGALTSQNIDTFLSECELFIEPNQNVFFDVSKLEYIDAAGIAQLLLIQNEINKAEQELLFSAVSKRIEKILYLNNVKQRFNINKSEK